jgi:hypothetical protein
MSGQAKVVAEVPGCEPAAGVPGGEGFVALSRVLTGISSFPCGAVPGTGRDPGRLPQRPKTGPPIGQR